MKQWAIFPVGIALALTACVSAKGKTEPLPDTLPNLGSAPELTNEVWLNVDAPLSLADLRGKVVALDMWTFG